MMLMKRPLIPPAYIRSILGLGAVILLASLMGCGDGNKLLALLQLTREIAPT